MSNIGRSWLWFWLSVAAFCAVMAREAWNLVAFDHRPPVVFDHVEVLNSPVRAGDVLTIRAYRVKVRGDCPVGSNALASDENGTTFPFLPTFSVGGPPGTPFFDATYAVPADLPPGTYELRDRLVYYCPGETFQIIQPIARFVVLGASE